MRCSHREIKALVIDVEPDEQELFDDRVAWMNLHPQLRRELQTKFSGATSQTPRLSHYIFITDTGRQNLSQTPLILNVKNIISSVTPMTSSLSNCWKKPHNNSL